MKKMNKKGFTLAELLIVVAIIAVLVAIAIPVFTAQLEKSREATDLANVRSAYAELMTEYLTWDGTDSNAPASKQVPVKQTQDKWQTYNNDTSAIVAEGIAGHGVSVPAKVAGTGVNYDVSISSGTGSITVG